MKQAILILLLISGTFASFSQNQSSEFTGTKSDQPRNQQADQMNFVPNELILKFKDTAPVSTGVRMKGAGINSVDKILQLHGVTSLEKLFPSAQKPLQSRMMKSPQGKTITIPALDKIYRVSIPSNQTPNNSPTNIFQLIEELKAQPEVEYAEPNYIYSIDNMQPEGPVLTAEDVQKLQINNQTNTTFTPNDPLFGQQWYIPVVKADLVWQQTTGDTTQVIAILDTGVDWAHPDLKNKMWKNPNPATTMTTDGLLNDIRGWDFINSDNNPMDDNSHGTHVAGIAAAETNNGIGIAGVCPKAKIMPIKVFQSSGQGDVATITKGIIYASTHGATVINMSFGSYARSLTMEAALSNAYATCVLVAAAGNDKLPLESCIPASPFFPAALSFVLGVQSPEATFSNFDCNGPIFSNTPDLLNYEMKAPGTNILSTVPNGNYRVYQGTSMAAPIISGLVELYRSMRPAESQEMLFGNLINSIDTYVDIQKALSIVPTPQLAVVSYEVADTLDGDRDGRPDVGETIELKVKVRNTWGQANNVKVGIAFKEFEDTTTATILTSDASVGSISAYASGFNVIPLKFKIAKNIADGRDINFVLKTWYDDHQGETSQPITINIENGVELKGVINSNMTLYPDKQYIITDNLAINQGVTLTIKPGTTLRFAENKSLAIGGNVIAIGTPDSLITLTKRDLFSSWNGIKIGTTGKMDLYYCKISYGGIFNNEIGNFINKDLDWSNNNRVNIRNVLFSNNYGYIGYLYNSNYSNNVFTENSIYNGLINFPHYAKISNNNFCHNYQRLTSGNSAVIQDYLDSPDSLSYNCIFNNPVNNKDKNIEVLKNQFFITSYGPNYYGTTNIEKINTGIYDFGENGSVAMIDISNKLTGPPKKNHGLVWKVLVNGKDAQDEFDKLDPLGVGKQKFEVYFNRTMDIKYPPAVTMGVRSPYTQNAIAENGIWSADSTIYTVYGTMKLTTGDGINTIRVSGAKDMDHFEIPIEDRRFRVVVNAATSSSLEFMATAGLGKVNLEWNNNKLADGLGFNMYRMEHINDSTLTKPALINKTLIADTLYTDFAVIPNKKYYYYYKIVRTDLSETDSSHVVSATPFTASKGDANGDLSVNVLDITTIVAYLLNNNPQPFIFEAADVNSDTKINVLDIVGVVNKVLNGAQKVRGMMQDKLVDLFLENDTLFANSNTPIGGIQLDIKGISSIEDIQILKALDGFESGNNIISDSLRLIFYSMSGKNIPAGDRIPLLKLKSGNTILNAIFGETNGSPIKVNYIISRIGNISNNMNQTVAELGQNFPNPVNGKTIIPIRIYEPVDEAVLRVINIMGQEVQVIRLANPTIGEHLLSWKSSTNKGLFFYTLEIRNEAQKQICPVKKMIVE